MRNVNLIELLSEISYLCGLFSSGWSRGGSVSMVSDYGLDGRAIEVRLPAEAADFSSGLCVQTGCGAHSATYPMGTGGLSLGVKRGRGVTLTTHPI
jgi:hypothetical protein